MSDDDWTRLDGIAGLVLDGRAGIAPARAFDEAGITRAQLAALRGRGVVERVRIGWYADPELPWQAKRAAQVGGAAACVTAASL